MKMLAIYTVCFILFPIIVLYGTKRKEQAECLLNKKETDAIKGIATCFIILAHLVNLLETAGVGYFKLLNLYSVTGGMGVLLFFFVSGYGIYKGYVDRKTDASFWKRRMENVLLPYVILKLSFLLIEMVLGLQSFQIRSFLLMFVSDWFIDVILIQYLIFYLAWKMSCMVGKNGKRAFFICNFVLSAVVAIIFWRLNFVARWYNGLFLFPVGMLIANYESELVKLWNKKWITGLCVNLLAFLMLGLIFATNKGELWADVIKTFAGIFLALLTCQILLRFDLNSKVMCYIGKKSLYYYIAHLSVIAILSKFFVIDATSAFFLVWILTYLAAMIFEKINNGIIKGLKICKR